MKSNMDVEVDKLYKKCGLVPQAKGKTNNKLNKGRLNSRLNALHGHTSKNSSYTVSNHTIAMR